jgi:endonuclease YncB( thermonuclease family)
MGGGLFLFDMTNIVAGKKFVSPVNFVTDGDTLILEKDGVEFKCRLRWIDAPETYKGQGKSNTDPKILDHWDWGLKSKNFLYNLVADKNVTVIPIEIDQYNRWVCDLYLGDRVTTSANIQLQLSNAGMCANSLPFQVYNFPTPRDLALFKGILTNCATAYKKKLGIWSSPDFILPYEFKKLIL